MLAENERPAGDVSLADYQALAEIRYQIRRFLRYSEDVARSADLEPQQHHLLLLLIGLPEGQATIGNLAERLQIRHHSAVGLVDRLEERGLVRRARNEADRRQVFVRLTPRSLQVLQGFAVYHRTELRSIGQELVRSLNALMDEANRADVSRFVDGQVRQAMD